MPEAGEPQHRKIVGAVADGDALLETQALASRNLLKQRRLAGAVHDRWLRPRR